MARTLSEHAAYELTKAGLANNEEPEARKVATDTMALVKRFEKQGHTEKSARFVLEAFERLCSLLPLTPITDDPDEWDKFEMKRKNVDTGEEETKEVWQSKRATSIFSEDKGKTFVDQRTGQTGESVDHIAQAKQMEEEEKVRKERKANAGKPAGERPIGHVQPDVPAGEAQFEAPSTMPPNDLAPGVASTEAAEKTETPKDEKPEEPKKDTK